MLENVRKLIKAVKENDLKLIYIISHQRSRSTALQISLAQGADGQYNEPGCYNCDPLLEKSTPTRLTDSNYHNDVLQSKNSTQDEINFDILCDKIFKHFMQLKQEKGKERSPIILVVNDVVMDMSKYDVERLLNLVSGIILLSRPPIKQMVSFFVRMVNNALCGFGSSNISCEQSLYLYSDQFRKLASSEKQKFLDTLSLDGTLFPYKSNDDLESKLDELLDDILLRLRTHWQHFDKLSQIIRNSLNSPPTLIIDGDDLVANTELTIMKTCEKMSVIPFDQSMLDDWKKCLGEDFKNGRSILKKGNAWTNAAIYQSSGFKNHGNAIAAASYTLNQLPPALAECIEKFTIIHNNILKEFEDKELGKNDSASHMK